MQHIVFTGGPCGGKTTILADAVRFLQERDFIPFVVPETATELIGAGFVPQQDPLAFQQELIGLQLAKEAHYHRLAKAHARDGKRAVLLYDRGIADARAYCSPEEFACILRQHGLAFGAVRDTRYDAVIHMQTAAAGAEEYYTCANNAARRETPAEARLLDRRLQEAWLGHPHHFIIANHTQHGWEAKKRRALKVLAHTLGIPEPLEQERKFLLSGLPAFPSELPVVTVHIWQYYLPTTDDSQQRVRCRMTEDGHATYIYTRKIPTETPGVMVEKERLISREEFERMRHIAQQNGAREICKKRLCFVAGDVVCELDHFLAPWELVVLEVEVGDIADKLALPQWLQTVLLREVTGTFSNAALALP